MTSNLSVGKLARGVLCKTFNIKSNTNARCLEITLSSQNPGSEQTWKAAFPSNSDICMLQNDLEKDLSAPEDGAIRVSLPT